MRALASLALISAALLAASCGDNGNGNGRGTPDAGGGGGVDGGLCPTPVDCANPACASAPGCQPGGDGGIDGGVGNATCGDGKTQEGEVCDDGNKTDGDGCDSTCTRTGCGNGVTTAGEQCDDGNLTDGDGCDRNCTPTACGNSIKTGTEQCDDGNALNWDGCDNACTQSVFTYVKASNTGIGDNAGWSVAMSADGTTLAVGAPQERSNATGVGGDQANRAAPGAGAVYVYVRSGTTWVQQAYIKASNTATNDQFGTSIALSADGATLAVGATEEDSGDAADPTNNAASNAGAAYVFSRTGDAWAQQAYVKAAQPRAGDSFGVSVALSGDGKTLAVGADGEDGAATGINGTPDTGASGAGAAYVFTVDAGKWTQQAYVKASNTGAGDAFGSSVALSSDGTTLAVGAFTEASGSGTDQADNTQAQAGAAYVFTLTGGAWSQQAYLKSDSPTKGDLFGVGLSLSGDGATLAIAAQEALAHHGAAFVFTRGGATWSQKASLKASNGSNRFGTSISLSSDASTLAVGSELDSSDATGVGGDQDNLDALLSGAAYVFANANNAWTQQLYIKAFNTELGDFFGHSLALSANGSLLAVGAFNEASSATGIGGDQASNGASQSGAVYVYQ